jgi:sulfate adenylyltransferase subunit 2
MDPLDQLENKSIYLIREAYARFHGSLALLWSMGKDSTALLWLVRKAFLGRIPFPILHIDTGYKFPEMYVFRDRLAKEWGFELVIGKNETKLGQGMGPGSGLKLECCSELKTNVLRDMITSHGFSAVILGIRRDEHGIRAKERHVHLLSIVGIKARWRGYRSLNKISSVERRIT